MMSNWQPGQPVVTQQDWQDWQAWRMARKLEQQRQRRASLTRIDYYPNKAALEAIREAERWNTPVSTLIDELILGNLPE
jgi:hypothetical protein